MSNIEKRVVEMQFDNQQFERGIQTSVKALDDLKNGLDFKDSAKSVNGLQSSLKTLSVQAFTDSVDFLKDRFSSMGIVGMRVLENITDSAMRMANRVSQTLITGPMTQGFAEYQTQQGAIQTILANTKADMEKAGMSESQRLDMVNSKLGELNKYADQTIYNFTEMTRNIGTFTAAGVDIDVATSSIKGIANLAALSGSNAQQASTAMYQLSQAISSGTVRLMDWNSVNNAGMGGEVFQNALIRTAKNFGVVGKEAKKAFKKLKDGSISFRDSLASGWLSDDILTETLSEMSIDFDAIMKAEGVTLEAAKELEKVKLRNKGYSEADAQAIVDLAQLATESATKVRTFSQLTTTLQESMQSGWTQTWQLIVGDFNEATDLLTTIKDYFDGVIQSSADSRNAIIGDWKASGGRQLMIDSFWNIINSIDNVVSAAKSGFEEIFPPTTAQNLKDMTQNIADFTAKIKAFTEDGEKMGKVSRIFKGIGAAVDLVKMAIEAVWNTLTGFVSKDVAPVLNLLDNLASVGDSLVSIRDKIKGNDVGKIIGETGQQIKDGVKPLEDVANSSAVNSIGTFLTGIGAKIQEFLGLSDGLDATGLIIAGLGAFLLYEIVKLARGIGRVKDAIVGGISDVFGGLTDACNSFTSKKDISQPILNFALALAAIAQAISIVAAIDPQRLLPSVLVLGGLLIALVVMAKTLGKMKTMQAINFGLVSAGLILLGVAMTQFAKAVATLGALDGPGLLRGIIGMGALFLEIAAFLAITKKVKPGIFNGVGYILLGVAMTLFAEAVSKIGSLDDTAVVRGIVGLGAVMTELAIFLAITKKLKVGVFNGVALILMAQAINDFAKAVEKLGKLNDQEIVKGIAGLGAVMLELSIFLLLTNKAKMRPNTGNDLLAMALAVNLFAFAIKKIGSLDTSAIVKGVMGLGAVMIELAIFMALTGKTKAEKFKSAGLIAMGIAMNLFATAISTIGKLDTAAIVRGVAGLGAVMLELVIFMALSKNLKVGVFKGIGLILMAESMNKFAEAVSKIGSLDSAAIVKGIVGLGAVMAELAIFMAVTKNTKIGVFKGTGLVLMAVSMYIFAETIARLGNLDTGAIVKGIIGLGAVLTEMAIFLAITNKLKMGMFRSAALIMMAISMNLFAVAISKIGKLETSQIVKGVMGLGAIILEVGMFTQLVGNISLSAIAKSLLVMGVMAIALIAFSVILGMVSGVQPGIMIEFATSMGIALLSVTAALLLFAAIPAPVILAGIANLALILGAIMGVMALFGALESLLNISSLIDKFGDIMESIGMALGRVIGGFVQGIFSGISNIGTELSAFMTNLQPFLDGVKSIDSSAITGVKTLAEVIVAIAGAGIADTVASSIIGKSSIASFVDNITLLGEGICAYAKVVSGLSSADQNGMNTATTIAKGIVDLANALPAQGGLMQKLEGSKDLGEFSKDIPKLGLALSLYAGIVSSGFKKVNKKTMAMVATTASGLGALANNIPERGGLKQLKNGTRDMAAFSKDIPVLGTALSLYASSVSSGFKKVNKQSLTNAAMTASGIAELANNIPESGGLKQKFMGAKDIGDFSADIPALGQSLKSYGESISGFKSVNKKAITNAADAAMGISTLANSIPETGGLKQKILGARDLGEFANDIPALGRGLETYATSIRNFSTVDENSSTQAAAAMKGISDLANAIPAQGGVLQRWVGVKDLGNFSEDIPKLGEGLSAYASSIKNFETVDSGASAQAKLAMDGMVALAQAIPEQGGVLQRWTGVKSLGKFSEDIPKLSEGLSAYASGVKNFETVDSGASAQAKLAMEGIAAIASAIPAQGGILERWTGVKSLGKFSEDIPKLSEGLAAYASGVKNFETVDTGASAQAKLAMDGIVAIANAIPAQGGILQRWTGVKSLGDFSADIPKLGDSLRAYVNYIADFPEIKKNASDSAVAAANAIVAIAQAAPEKGGLVQLWAGAKDIGSFADDMPQVGGALKAYANSILGFPAVTDDDISKATATANALKAFSETLPDTGGWLQTIAGQKNLGTFGEGVTAIGDGLSNYATSVAGIGNTGDAGAVVQSMVDLAKGIADGTIAPYTLGDLGTNIETLGTNVKNFCDTLTQITMPANLESVVKFIQDMQDVAVRMSGLKDVYNLSNYISDIGWDLQGFANYTKNLDADKSLTVSAFVKNIADAAITAQGIKDTSLKNVQELLNNFAKLKITNVKSDGTEEALSRISELVSGIQNGAASVISATNVLVNSGISAVYQTYSKWFNAGKYLGQGLSRGLASMAGVVRATAGNVAAGAVSAVQTAWDEHSPSRVGEDLGMYFDLGIAGGFKQYSKIVSQSATDMGDDAVTAATSALSRFKTNLTSDLDTTPTIRPIIDMTDINKGVGTINGMFGGINTLRPGMFSASSFNQSVSRMNYSDPKTVMTTDNSDVVQAINSLTEKFNTLSNSVANMGIRLDGNTLVGRITPLINQALNRAQMRNNRGNNS